MPDKPAAKVRRSRPLNGGAMVDVARKSRFREGGQANVVEEAAKVLRAVATDLAENREGAPQMFVDATVGALEYKASLLDLVVAELREGIYT
jgi:hypothetical protein